MNEQALPTPAARPPWWVFALLATASALMLSECWDAGFSGRDDNRYVVQHPVVSGQAPLREAITRNELELYLPVTLLSYALDRALFAGWMPGWLGTWAPGCRLMSWLYHLLAGWILWRWVLPRLRLSATEAAFVAALFLLHPVQAESVCWIAERKTVLSGLFGLAALAFQMHAGPPFRKPSGWRRAAALGSFALCLGAKISGLGAGLALLAWEWTLGPDAPEAPGAPEAPEAGRSRKKRAARAAWRLLPFALTGLLFVFPNWASARRIFGLRLGGSWSGTLLSDVNILARYFALVAWPPLSSPYYLVEPIVRPFTLSFLWAMLFFGGPLALLWRLSKADGHARLAAFGWAWYFGALFPYLNFVRNAEFMHDRYLYLSLPGLGLALVAAWRGLKARWRALAGEKAARFARGGLVLFALWLSVLLVSAGGVWRGEIETFRRAARRQPRSSFGNGYLGLALGVAANVAERQGGGRGMIRAWRGEAVRCFGRAERGADLNYNLRRVQFYLAHALLLRQLGRRAEARAALLAVRERAAREGWDTPQDRKYLGRAEKMLRELREDRARAPHSAGADLTRSGPRPRRGASARASVARTP